MNRFLPALGLTLFSLAVLALIGEPAKTRALDVPRETLSAPLSVPALQTIWMTKLVLSVPVRIVTYPAPPTGNDLPVSLECFIYPKGTDSHITTSQLTETVPLVSGSYSGTITMPLKVTSTLHSGDVYTCRLGYPGETDPNGWKGLNTQVSTLEVSGELPYFASPKPASPSKLYTVHATPQPQPDFPPPVKTSTLTINGTTLPLVAAPPNQPNVDISVPVHVSNYPTQVYQALGLECSLVTANRTQNNDIPLGDEYQTIPSEGFGGAMLMKVEVKYAPLPGDSYKCVVIFQNGHQLLPLTTGFTASSSHITVAGTLPASTGTQDGFLVIPTASAPQIFVDGNGQGSGINWTPADGN